MTVLIRDFLPDDAQEAERLADMFNDFDSAWPGGFTRGDRQTGERITERKSTMRRLAILVAQDTENGDLVGYCDLDAQPEQKETAYVGLLGARLSVHGKGVGKALIREAIRRSAETGYREVTLYTWAGNTKAVPLYKKTGFNWVPDTDVYMRNFIPSVLASPIARDFIGDRDWYSLHERDLTVAPDNVTWKGMKIYPYRFRSGDETLTLSYQADTAGLTAIETADFAVSCVIPVEEAASGQTYPIVWDIESRRGKTLEVVLLTESDPDLSIAVQERFTVDASLTLTRDLTVSSTAMPRRAGQRAHLVRSTLLIDGQPLTLETGVKVVQPIEIQYSGQALTVGRDEKIVVGLRNRLHRAVTGSIALDAHAALHCSEPVLPFYIPSRSWTQCEFTVNACESGAHASSLRYTADPAPAAIVLEGEGRSEYESSRNEEITGAGMSSARYDLKNTQKVEGRKTVFFRAFAGGESLASIDTEDEEKAVLESMDLRVEVHLRGGETMVFAQGGPRRPVHANAQLGPPFGSTQMRPPLYSARIESQPQGVRLRITAPSHQAPGLTLERAFSIAAGGILKIEHRVINTTVVSQAAKVRIRTLSPVNDFLALPMPEGLVREPMQSEGEFPAGETDFIAPGAQLAETWMAIEGEGHVFGLVWRGEPVQDVEWSKMPYLTYDLGELPPHSARTVPDYWLVAMTGDWLVVRNWWKRLVQPAGVRENERLVPARIVSLSAEPGPVLLRSALEDVTLAIHSRRGNGTTGTMSLSGREFQADPGILSIEKLDRDRPLRAQVSVTGPKTTAASYLDARFDTGILNEQRKLPVVRLTAGDQLDVSQPKPGMVVIENGVLTLRFDTSFFGALTALETGGVNHLFSAWPEAKPFVWMNPWFGGVHAFNHWMGDSELARETFTGEPMERIGARGWLWRGVRMSCDLTHKDRSWLRVEVEYLTLPGSNAVALVLRYTNRSSSRMAPNGGVVAWSQPGGSRSNTILHWERNGERRTRRRGGFNAEGESGRWTAVENPETGDSLIMIATHPSDSAAWEDFGAHGPHIQARGHVQLEPSETRERLFWLVHSTEIAQVEAYGAALTEARCLP